MLFDAFTFQLGYNANLVTVGAVLLGIGSGVAGSFLFLRKRALVSDAISHATLPGIAGAFMVMVALGGDGRNLIGLLLGSAVSAGIGLLIVHWLSTRTRLEEDASIGAVLSVFFGFGVVLLTVIQTMTSGRQAGLESFLLGSTAGMLFVDAIIIALASALVLFVILIMHRPIIAAAFDPEYAASRGTNVGAVDLATMGLVMAVTVIGLKIVGLILIVALLIIPPVTARFWTDRIGYMVLSAAAVGGFSAWIGVAISATAPSLPTGPIIVLVAFAMFLMSLVIAPNRGLFSAWLRIRKLRAQVHIRQGLLSMAQGQPIYERLTLRLLRRAGLARADGVPTETGRALAAKALRDEKRWEVAKSQSDLALATAGLSGLDPIESALTADQIAEVDRLIGPPEAV